MKRLFITSRGVVEGKVVREEKTYFQVMTAHGLVNVEKRYVIKVR